jgi:hypothetical protein
LWRLFFRWAPSEFHEPHAWVATEAFIKLRPLDPHFCTSVQILNAQKMSPRVAKLNPEKVIAKKP